MESVSAAWEAEQSKNFCCRGAVTINLFNKSGLFMTTITTDEISAFTLTERADRNSNVLPENKLILDLIDPNNRFTTTHFLPGCKLVVRMGYAYTDGTTEYVNGGTFYVQKADKSDNGLVKWNIVAKDRLSTFTNIYNKGAFVPPGNYNKLYNIAKNVLTDLGLTEGSDYDISDLNNANYKSANILPQVTHATALQILANAAAKTLFCGRDGKIYIKNIASSTDYTIINKNLYKKPTEKNLTIYGTYQTTLHNFRAGSMVDVATITKTVNGTETITLPFSEPVLYPTVYLKSGTGSISNVTTYARYAVFDLTASGTSATIAVQGMPMIASDETYTNTWNVNGDIFYNDNPMISVAISPMPMGVPPEHEGLIEWRANPRVGVHDRIMYDSALGNDMLFSVEECKIVYNGGYKGTIKGRF